MINRDKIKQCREYIVEVSPCYLNVLVVALSLWLADSYIVSVLDTLNSWCIQDLNSEAFGWVTFASSVIYVIYIYKMYKNQNLYITHQYMSWWSAGLWLYFYFRYISSHYVFWGFDVLYCHVAYLDIMFPIFIFLFILKAIRKSNNTQHGELSNILNDEPISDKDNDLFGYKAMAKSLMDDLKIIDVSEHAYSVGVAGEWGTGKSSFLNLFEESAKEDKNITVRFYPRSSTRLETVQDDFFATFTSAIAKYHTGISSSIAKYMHALKLVEGEGVLNKIVDAFDSVNIEDQKENINRALTKINRKVFVIIEDLDRLSGKELLEVLKLIDRNGDFCNVFYLSAYDKVYVNSVLQKELGHTVARDYTDKYFCYELPLPVQKQWVMKQFISNYLQSHTINVASDKNYKKELVTEWNNVGESVVSTLGTLRHVKRFINLLMSRYAIVMDDVNIGDFLLLTLIRYKNVNVYHSIARCEIVVRGGFISGSKTMMYLAKDYKQKMKELDPDNKVSKFVTMLFPKQDETSVYEGVFKRLRRSESFELYFYDRYSNRIYYKDIVSIFEEDDDEKALDGLNDLYSNRNNWDSIEEYLRYQGTNWITDKNILKRYIKLIIQAYHNTNRNLNYYVTFIRLFFKHTSDEFIRQKTVNDEKEYADILYACIDEMIPRCCLSVGLMLTELLHGFEKRADKPDECVLQNQQYLDLAMKALVQYTEHTGENWYPFAAIKIAAIAPVDKSGIYDKAQKYILKKMNEKPQTFADSMLTASVYDNGKGNSLVISLQEPNVLKYVFGGWEPAFERWIKKLPTEDMKYVFAELLLKIKDESNIVVKAQKNKYIASDYVGFRAAIEKDKEERKQTIHSGNVTMAFEFIASHNDASLSDIAQHLNVSTSMASKVIKKLVQSGRIVRVGSSRNCRYLVSDNTYSK